MVLLATLYVLYLLLADIGGERGGELLLLGLSIRGREGLQYSSILVVAVISRTEHGRPPAHLMVIPASKALLPLLGIPHKSGIKRLTNQ